MTRIKFLIPFILFFSSTTVHCFGQQLSLSISDLSGFPIYPPDSAFQGSQYTLQAQVVNLDSNSVSVNNYLYITLRNDSAPIQQQEDIDSLFILTLAPYDTLNISA